MKYIILFKLCFKDVKNIGQQNFSLAFTATFQKEGHALFNDITIITQVCQNLKPLFLGRSTRRGAKQIGLL